jgi:hypothetical protein
MGKSNYKLTDEQKEKLDEVVKDLVFHIEEICLSETDLLDLYDANGNFDNNKFTAIVWHIGDKLSIY